MIDDILRDLKPYEVNFIKVLDYYASQFARIPKQYQLLPYLEIEEYVTRKTISHFRHKYFKKFEEE